MPFLTVNTNATMNDSDVFVEEAARFVAAELHKPVNYVIVTLNVNAKMSFGGSTEHSGALVELRSVGLGDLGDLAPKLTDFLVEKLRLDRQFVNIEFMNIDAARLSIGGHLLG